MGEYREVPLRNAQIYYRDYQGDDPSSMLECQRCGGLVVDRDRHDAWHRWVFNELSRANAVPAEMVAELVRADGVLKPD